MCIALSGNWVGVPLGCQVSTQSIKICLLGEEVPVSFLIFVLRKQFSSVVLPLVQPHESTCHQPLFKKKKSTEKMLGLQNIGVGVFSALSVSTSKHKIARLKSIVQSLDMVPKQAAPAAPARAPFDWSRAVGGATPQPCWGWYLVVCTLRRGVFSTVLGR